MLSPRFTSISAHALGNGSDASVHTIITLTAGAARLHYIAFLGSKAGMSVIAIPVKTTKRAHGRIISSDPEWQGYSEIPGGI
jgi:hypothetical protein